MIAKSLIAATAVAATMALAPVPAAEAKTNIDIKIGIGLGGYHPGYGRVYVRPGHGPGYISCHRGKNIVDASGFNKVHAVDCSLPGYRFTAWKAGHKYLVQVNRYGAIVDVDRIF
jgi:hypothetical protein